MIAVRNLRSRKNTNAARRSTERRPDASPFLRSSCWSRPRWAKPNPPSRPTTPPASPPSSRSAWPEHGGYGGTAPRRRRARLRAVAVPAQGVRARPGTARRSRRWRPRRIPTYAAWGQDCCGNGRRARFDGGRFTSNTFDGHTIAMDAATGRVAWDVRTAAPEPGGSLPNAPLVAEGKVSWAAGAMISAPAAGSRR